MLESLLCVEDRIQAKEKIVDMQKETKRKARAGSKTRKKQAKRTVTRNQFHSLVKKAAQPVKKSKTA